jgi:LysM repeat protein
MFKIRAILTAVAIFITAALMVIHPTTAKALPLRYADPGAISPGTYSIARVNPVTHIVKTGESLSSISVKFKVTWQSTYCANQKKIGTNPNFITPGERLVIPRTKISCKINTDGNSSAAIQQGVTVSQYNPPQAPLTQIQQMAWNILPAANRQSEYDCLNQVIMIESGWNPYAQNASSGAYGIPQALPGSKMSIAGPDWATNPYTQLVWMIDDYIPPMYGDSCGALAHERSYGWY